MAESKIYSEFLVGLAIAWTAGGVGTPFVTQDFSLKGVSPLFLGVFTSLVCLRIAVEYRKRF
ncbi:hypothetical protein ISR94_00790 [Candidatus Microgenomates bacterium]|nr:hypothetical protein [Candidatus Microgenomates bacterium]